MKIGQHEQAWKPAREEFETIDAGNEKIRENWRYGLWSLLKKEKSWLLWDFMDVFAWSYKDVPGLYMVPLVEGCKSVKKE